jgi:fatty-acyl-CoA synthase
MDEDGYYYLIDRKGDMFISGGENVYPAEVERILRSHPGIEDIAVVGVPDEKWGEVGYAFVMPKQGVDLAPEDVIGFCEGQLARYKWPQKVIVKNDFPRTALGKVRKTVLKQMELKR